MHEHFSWAGQGHSRHCRTDNPGLTSSVPIAKACDNRDQVPFPSSIQGRQRILQIGALATATTVLSNVLTDLRPDQL
jgi:hypothetical protein